MTVQRRTGRGPRGLAFVCAALAALAVIASTAQAYTFGEPAVRAGGPEVRVFDWSAQKCTNDDIPDQPTRAFRDSNGQVVMINSHFTVRRYLGGSLATVAKLCPGIMFSGLERDPSLYDDREWLASTYTQDGVTVYGLIHAEHQGWQDEPGYCIRAGESFADRQKCWYNALTLTSSTNGGASFTHTAAPTHYVGGAPYTYTPGTGPIGAFQPSNIVPGKDGLFYVLVHVEGYGVQPTGTCLWRTGDLGDPRSWRAWGGTAFDVQLRDPYVVDFPPEEGVCTPLRQIGTRSESLTWSTYLKKWVLVGSADNADGVSGPGFYFYTSDDLINWSTAKLLMKAELPWTYRCQDGPEQLRDPSLLDNDSPSRNFDTIGQRPFLFFTRFNVQFNSPTSCYTSLDRDLIRIPVEFSIPPVPDPDPDPVPDPEPEPQPEPDPQPDPNPSPGAGGASSGSTPSTPTASVQVSAPPIGLFRVFGKPRSRADGSLALRVHAPAAGRFTLRALGRPAAVRPASKQASKAGTVTVTIRLSRAGKVLLRKKPQARVRTALMFTPVGGAPQRSTGVLTLRRARTR